MHSKTATIFILSLIALMTFVGVYAFVLAQVMSRAAAVSEISGTLTLEQEQAVRLRDTKNIIRDTKEHRTVLNEYVLAPDGVVSVLQELDALAESARVDLQVTSVQLEPLDLERLKWGERLRLSLSADGSFARVAHFLFLVESLPLAVSVHQASLERSESIGGKNETWQGSFNIAIVKHK